MKLMAGAEHTRRIKLGSRIRMEDQEVGPAHLITLREIVGREEVIMGAEEEGLVVPGHFITPPS